MSPWHACKLGTHGFLLQVCLTLSQLWQSQPHSGTLECLLSLKDEVTPNQQLRLPGSHHLPQSLGRGRVILSVLRLPGDRTDGDISAKLLSLKLCVERAQWHTPLGPQARQAEECEREASLGYIEAQQRWKEREGACYLSLLAWRMPLALALTGAFSSTLLSGYKNSISLILPLSFGRKDTKGVCTCFCSCYTPCFESLVVKTGCT